tara:strand:+ start:7287 stop:7697 length:411 start_codon:yes stop_codon:yes gene_type:complete
MTKEKIEKHLTALRMEKDTLQKRIYKGEEMLRDQEISKEKAIETKVKEDFAKNGVSEDCIKLLKEMEFRGLWCGDTVSIGVDGKRPFGNSSATQDVGEILGWEGIEEYGLSGQQEKKAWELMRQLPMAVNQIIKNL